MRTIGWRLSIALLALLMAGSVGAQPPAPGAAGQGANVREEVRTAHWHSYGGYDGSTLNYVQGHLGHALNCLEGPKGKKFNKAHGNVCAGLGNGILVDLKDEPGLARFMILARAADALAFEGEKSKDLAEVGRASRGVAALLCIILTEAWKARCRGYP